MPRSVRQTSLKKAEVKLVLMTDNDILLMIEYTSGVKCVMPHINIQEPTTSTLKTHKHKNLHISCAEM